MKDFINKLQKDLKGLQDAIKKDSDELLTKVKTYANKEHIVAATVEVEKLVETRLKKLEPTINKVVGEIRKNASKAGFDVDEIEAKVRSNVTKATNAVKDAAEKRGFTKAAKDAAEKAKTAAKSAAKTASTKAKAVSKTAKAKAKAPTSKAATRRKAPTKKAAKTAE